MNTNTKSVNKFTLKHTYKDLRKLFGIQLQEFAQQFLLQCNDIEAFLVDCDNNAEFLHSTIDEWCEMEESNVADDLNAAASIFLLAFIQKIDEETEDETATEEESESGGPFSST